MWYDSLPEFLSSQQLRLALRTLNFLLDVGLLLLFILHSRKPNALALKNGSRYLIIVLVSESISCLYSIHGSLLKIGCSWASIFPRALAGRIDGITNIFFYTAVALLFESLLKKTSTRKLSFAFLSIIISGLFAITFIGCAIYSPSTLTQIDFFTYSLVHFYTLILIAYALSNTLYHIFKNKGLPRLLHYQLQTFILLLFIPQQLLLKFATFRFSLFPYFPITKNYAFLNISTSFLMLTLYFVATRLVRVRFLNLKDHVALPQSASFANNFRGIIGTLGTVTKLAELRHVTERFFTAAFSLPHGTIRLVMLDEHHPQALTDAQLHALSSAFNDEQFVTFMQNSRIFIRDEIEFSYFYSEDPLQKEALTLLGDLQADILIPIFNKQTLSGILLVDRHARMHRFFSERERDEMLIFVAYLCPVINLLRNRSLESLLIREKQLETELQWKHEEVNQYRESIRSFLQQSEERQFGILFYRQNKFIAVTEETSKLLACDPNVHQRHPVTQALKALITKATRYKTVQITTVTIGNKQLLCSAVPERDRQQSFVITLTPPHLADILHHQMNSLKDPSQWDYLLYLETTASGKLVNELLPGSSEKLLNFKIELLKHALSQQPLLIHGPKEDMRAIAQLVHTISLREHVVSLRLKEPERNGQYAQQLFGINPLFQLAAHEQSEPALLDRLNKVGTLIIENINYLAPDTQKQLAAYLHTGMFHAVKSEQTVSSSVRIICSLVDDETPHPVCLPELLAEFKPATLTVPTLDTFDKDEFSDLVKGLTVQLNPDTILAPEAFMPARETNMLYHVPPASISDLKKRVYGIVVNKQETVVSADTTQPDTEVNCGDDEINKIILLGKRALSDRHAMEILWKRFQSQTKIATLLGVNRSSVNRRCKDYHFTETPSE